MKNAGFTLLELLVVFSVIGILSTVGVAAFVNYSRSQVVNSATLELSTVFNTAKSRSLSQVRPTGCSSLEGYKVAFCQLSQTDCLQKEVDEGKDYALYAVCSGELFSPAIESEKLPADITTTFPQGAQKAFVYRILSGSVDGAMPTTGTKITLTGSVTKSVTVYSDGRIMVQ